MIKLEIESSGSLSFKAQNANEKSVCNHFEGHLLNLPFPSYFRGMPFDFFHILGSFAYAPLCFETIARYWGDVGHVGYWNLAYSYSIYGKYGKSCYDFAYQIDSVEEMDLAGMTGARIRQIAYVPGGQIAEAV